MNIRIFHLLIPVALLTSFLFNGQTVCNKKTQPGKAQGSINNNSCPATTGTAEAARPTINSYPSIIYVDM